MLRFAAIALLLSPLAASAQDRASVRIVGHVSQMASLRFHEASLTGPGVTGGNASADGSVDYTLNLGDVGIVRGRDNGVRGGRVVLAVRTNAPYVLSATVTANGLRQGHRELQLSDIGFGIPELRASGARATTATTRVVDPRVTSDPVSAPIAEGVPEYAMTLQDLQGGAPLVRGDGVSNGGTLHSSDNALLVSTHYAVQPQYFAPNDGFEAVVTYTLSTP